MTRHSLAMTHPGTDAAQQTFSMPRFTGKERDSESGNDNFGARYYASTMGRFMSPDPGWFFSTRLENPQTWNLYSYVLNNPLGFVDPDGYDCVYLNNAGTDVDRDSQGNPIGIDQNSNKGECDENHGKWVDGTVTNVFLSSTSNDVFLTGQLADGSQTSSGTDYLSGGSSTIVVSADGPPDIGTLGYVGAYIPPLAPGGFEMLKGVDPWPRRLFGTHWCGPGGGGVPINGLDAACKAHDQCFDAAGISAASNNGGGNMTLQQAAAASKCNAALSAAAQVEMGKGTPGATRVFEWLKHGDQLLVITGGRIDGHLAVGTATR